MAEGLVEIRFSEARLAKLRKQLAGFPGAVPKVVSRALNDTARGLKTDAARRIAEKVIIKIGAVKKQIPVKKATTKRWQATLNISSKRIPLIEFKAKEGKKGVSYKIDQAGGRKRIRQAFIETMPQGRHIGVFIRKRRRGAFVRRVKNIISGKAGPGDEKLVARKPIMQLYGPSLGAIFERAGDILRQTTDAGHKKLEQNIDQRVNYYLKTTN